MWTRRQFLMRGAAVSLALAQGRRALSAPVPKRKEDEAGKLITPALRKVIDAGLKSLGAGQHDDGSFGRRGYQGNLGITSLAALAFLAAGHEPDDSPRGKIVGKALDFVLSQENRQGGHPGYLHNPNASPHGPMYNHGFATLFLAFLHGKKKDKSKPAKYGEVLERAVQLLVASQNKEGGWRYTPTSKDADITVTACQMMALAAARQAGLKVPKETTDAGVGYIKKCFTPATGAFVYMLRGGGRPVFSRTAAAVAALQAMGIHKGEEIEKGLAFLDKERPAPTPRPDMHFYFGRYYAARVMHVRGGETWKEWYAALAKELQGQQQADGSWIDQIDPHYATAMACLVLLTPEGRLTVRSDPKKDKD
ncbi:MAG TPA: prenyltransferase/squalene oxidase repeat-containing protein [Gemmataceae bacterium]|nr:prenyltransferase/squalene oxidase repeat-containing protein [Gemmataceae bacterium]